MRITWVLPTPHISGGTKVIGIYARKLLERGHDVNLVYPIPSWPKPWRIRTLMYQLKKYYRYGRFDLTHLSGIPEERLLARVGKSTISNEDVPPADAVIATWWKTAHWVNSFSPDKGKKYHFVQGYEVMVSEKNGDIDATWRLPLRKITISKWLQDLARDKFNQEAVLVPNGVDTAQFHTDPRPHHDPPTLGFLYSSGWWKGSDVIFEVIRRVRDTLSNLRVVSFGTSSPNGGFPQNGTFYLKPRQDFIRNIYSQCDIWLCASRSEGFHLPPLEAMACRCPVVSTRVGGPLDYINEGINGHLVDVEDTAGLTKCLIALLLDPERLARMSQAAFETSLLFSWERSADLFLNALTGKDEISSC